MTKPGKMRAAVLDNLDDFDMRDLHSVLSGRTELMDHTDLYGKLFRYYMDTGAMPYGTAKARTGDPDIWITNQINYDLKHLKESWPIK